MNLVCLAVILIGLSIFCFPRGFAKLTASFLTRLPAPVQSAYRAGNLGHSYDSEYWANYYRFASAGMVVVVAAIWLLRRN